ncbi:MULTISPECIES: DUF4386 domain-containing protein [Micromonospora]|uniref:DUF4386 domain-containing protein n=1 Tax=Micromonospora maris TaxID=1003110 RepID=A0A9X0LEZ0_9ACTN|nr:MULTISPECIES: DUF4386 domain-containing protein [Micromonospora]AEB42244.1 hypothetical protein VAB18032_05590 [Micromonospora maris AB-18-032]KUJ47746.1 hypothetical protein ADL17_01105 [Micromonospora maris]RUL90952.1 DUF4386 domain-containing protein [Verrucosispora sp. FIM060022]
MPPLIRTARTTGLLYLGLAIAGALGFLTIRPRIFAAGDPEATLAHLVQNESLARVAIALELLVVLTQTGTAVWFYRLFRTVDGVAAGCIAAFGMVNAIAILGSAALLATATEVAAQPFGDAADSVQLLYLVSGNLWTVGGLFFGLWLVPMGLCVLRSGWLPRALGWVLVAGGVGYLLHTFVAYLAPGTGMLADLLVVPATVGEFWILGYLIILGVRRSALPTPAEAPCR